MSEDNIITEDDCRFEYLESLSNGYPEVHIQVMVDVAPEPGLFEDVVIEIWRKVFINHRPAWKRVDAT